MDGLDFRTRSPLQPAPCQVIATAFSQPTALEAPLVTPRLLTYEVRDEEGILDRSNRPLLHANTGFAMGTGGADVRVLVGKVTFQQG